MAKRMVCRVRVPIRTSSVRRRRRVRRRRAGTIASCYSACQRRFGVTGKRSRRGRRRRGRRIRGGFLPALVPIIAAAIGAIPGIAGVAIQASQRH